MNICYSKGMNEANKGSLYRMLHTMYHVPYTMCLFPCTMHHVPVPRTRTTYLYHVPVPCTMVCGAGMWCMVRVPGTYVVLWGMGTNLWNTNPGKVAEHGGWLVQYGTVKAMDKALDNDPTSNHTFLKQRESLVERKREDPKSRITSSANPFGLNGESVSVAERRTQGLKGPKKQFIDATAYEKRFGMPPPPDKVKTQWFGGALITGVDIIKDEDIALLLTVFQWSVL